MPRYFTMAARVPEYDLQLEDGVTYFTTDGCGVQVVDLDSQVERASRKSDVAMMARVADYLPSIGFVWPMVSAQDYGRRPPSCTNWMPLEQLGQARPVRDDHGRARMRICD